MKSNYIVFSNDSLLYNHQKKSFLIENLNQEFDDFLFHKKIYQDAQQEIYCVEIPTDIVIPHYELANLRYVLSHLPEIDINIIAKLKNLYHWHKKNQFCGGCGHSTKDKNMQLKICPHCKNEIYPHISPAMMVAIIKNDKILLANGVNWPKDFYSVLAGFVDAGETIEECVHREVKEEVGLTVKNLRYFSSQAWPFPHSLMLAFIADYDSGKIIVDKNELTHAKWFPIQKLPHTPTKISIAGKLISHVLDNYPHL